MDLTDMDLVINMTRLPNFVLVGIQILIEVSLVVGFFAWSDSSMNYLPASCKELQVLVHTLTLPVD